MQFVAQAVPGSRTRDRKSPTTICAGERLCPWTSSWRRLAERRWRRDATSEIGVQQSVRYEGALPWRQWPWLLTFRPQISSTSYCVSTKLEVSMAFLLRENRKHRRHRRRDGRSDGVQRAREGSTMTFHTHFPMVGVRQISWFWSTLRMSSFLKLPAHKTFTLLSVVIYTNPIIVIVVTGNAIWRIKYQLFLTLMKLQL